MIAEDIDKIDEKDLIARATSWKVVEATKENRGKSLKSKSGSETLKNMAGVR